MKKSDFLCSARIPHKFRNRSVCLRKEFQTRPLFLMAVVHATSHRKYIYPSDKRAVPNLCSHKRSCNKCLPTVYHTMSTRHHSRHKTCSFRESSHTFPKYFTSTSGDRAEFRTLSDVIVVSFITRISRTPEFR